MRHGPEDIIESCDIIKQVFKHYQHSALPNIWGDPRVKARIEELKKTVMYNILHLALMAGYGGKVNLKNFKQYAISPEEAGKRENPSEREMNYETFVLDIVKIRIIRQGNAILSVPITSTLRCRSDCSRRLN